MKRAHDEDQYSQLLEQAGTKTDELQIAPAAVDASPSEFDDRPFREISQALHQGLSRVKDGFRDLTPEKAHEEISTALREVVMAYKLLIRAKSHLSAREKALRVAQRELDPGHALKTSASKGTVEELRGRIARTKKENETLRKTLQLPADLVEAIPLGLLVYQYQSPGELFCLEGNPEALRLIEVRHCRGVEFDEMWPNARGQGLTDELVKTAGTGNAFKTERAVFRVGNREKIFRVRAFSMPADRLGVAIEDITEKR